MSSGPIRTCVGCRCRSERDALLRVVWDAEAGLVRLDPGRRLPGRGASLHPDQRCWEQAIRRRALGRALRIRGVDGGQVRELWQQWAAGQHRSPSVSAPDGPTPGDDTRR